MTSLLFFLKKLDWHFFIYIKNLTDSGNIETIRLKGEHMWILKD